LAVNLSGQNFIAGNESALGQNSFHAVAAATGEILPTEFHMATPAEIHDATEQAAVARPLGLEDRAALLEAIAEEIEALGDELLDRAHIESALPLPRLTGERGRTCGQLRLFATSLRSGLGQEVITDAALPDRQPVPRPEIRRVLVPIGPVAVFGASNFPLAFSVAGGDTASALASGCPVIVKAHPLHPGTSELVARAIYRAIARVGVDARIFSMVHGAAETGATLAESPDLRAIAFTGSLKAGMALVKTSQNRPTPIPVFAEMGSINPVFLLPNALAARGEALAAGYAESLTMGVGQFCTNPGVIIGIASPALDEFTKAVTMKLNAVNLAPMLSGAIKSNFEAGVETLLASAGPELTSGSGCRFFRVTATEFAKHHALREECFGPAGLLVECQSEEELLEVAEIFEGQLTVTIQLDAADADLARRLRPIATGFAGRVVYNGFPTGVEVGHAMQHGGPFPASSDSRFTSVGTQAIYRFLRPVAIQNEPSYL